ncbi:MAG: hypothetical protein ACXWJK_15060 [Burkholderiaceae bacterium]
MSDLNINSMPQTVSHALQSAAVAANNVAQQANQANLAQHSDLSEEVGLASFNERAGVKPYGSHHHQPVTLQERLKMLMSHRVRSRRQVANATHIDSDEPDAHLHIPGFELLDALLSGGRSDLDAYLVDHYDDPLMQHTFLSDAKDLVDQLDASQGEKGRVTNELNSKLAELMDKYGDAIRSGLSSKEAFESALGKMDALSAADNAAHHAGSRAEVLALYGVKANGKVETALTPLALTKSLVDKFGANNFSKALGGLQSKTATEFRAKPAHQANPRLSLTLAWAASFEAVQSIFALAGDLRRDLSERAGIMSKANQAATCMALLGITEQGGGRAHSLVGQIADSTLLTALQQMRLYLMTQQAVKKMPLTIWHKDLLPQRTNLLDELRTLTSDLSEKIERAPTEAAQLEEEMRGKVQRKNPRNQDGSAGQRCPNDGVNDSGLLSVP